MVDFIHMRDIFRRLDTLADRRQGVTSKAYGTSVNLDGMPHGKGTQGSKVENCAIELVQIDESIARLQRELQQQQDELKQLLPLIRRDVYRKVLELRYIDQMKAREIAIATGYSDSNVFWQLRTAEGIVRKLQENNKS